MNNQQFMSSSSSSILQNCRLRKISLFLSSSPMAASTAFFPSMNHITLCQRRLTSMATVCPSITVVPPLRELPFSHTFPLQELQASEFLDLYAQVTPKHSRVQMPIMMFRQLVLICLTLNWQVLPQARGTLRMKECQMLSQSFLTMMTLCSPRQTLKLCQCGLSKKLQNYSMLNFLWNYSSVLRSTASYWRCKSLSFMMLFILKSFFLYYSASYSPSRFISAISYFKDYSSEYIYVVFLCSRSIFSSFTAISLCICLLMVSHFKRSISFWSIF